jgi:hypothetical protein
MLVMMVVIVHVVMVMVMMVVMDLQATVKVIARSTSYAPHMSLT